MNYTYDLIIIGGGASGLTAAKFASQLGARAALVEKRRSSSDCTWMESESNKALIQTAKVVHQMRFADIHGLTPVKPEVDLKSVMAHVGDVVSDLYGKESPEALQGEGIDVFPGSPRFLDPHTIDIGNNILTSRYFLLFTGAHSFIPSISGLDDVEYFTSENIWNLKVLPRHLLIVGSGPIGCEMAQAFRRLGSDVTIVEKEEHILPREEEEAADVLTGVFTSEGINIYCNTIAKKVWSDGKEIHLVRDEDELVGDRLFIAVGRRPNVEGLDLEKAGVSYNPKGIWVDNHLRTRQLHIYAAGDCIGSYQSTHYDGSQALTAVRNALLPGSTKDVADRVPWTTFTDPEVAHVGLTQEQAREEFGDLVMTYRWPMERVDQLRSGGDTPSLIELVHSKDGILLGATIVASHAEEMIREWVLALKYNLRVSDLASTIHIYPTYSMASMEAEFDIRVAEMMSGLSGRIVRGLTRLMRRNFRVPSVKPKEAFSSKGG